MEAICSPRSSEWSGVELGSTGSWQLPRLGTFSPGSTFHLALCIFLPASPFMFNPGKHRP